jgi:hypothetical protein
MALSKKDYLLSVIYGLFGLCFMEIGVLSVYVAIAYLSRKGSFLCGLSGLALMCLGGFLLIRAKRRFLRKE